MVDTSIVQVDVVVEVVEGLLQRLERVDGSGDFHRQRQAKRNQWHHRG